MKCDEIPARRDGIDAAGLLPEGRGVHHVGGKRFVGLVFAGGQIERDVGLLEGGDLVVTGVFGVGLVSGTVDQVQVQAVLAFADHDGFLGERDLGIGGIAQIGHEHALPHGGTLGALHVLHVEDDFGESFVEHSRLDFEGNLRTFQAVFEMTESGLGSRGDVESVDKSHEPCGDDEEGKGAKEAPDAHAAGAHGGDFTVGGETAEADQDADQHAHGKRVGEGERDGEEENFGDAGQGSAGADHEFENASQIASEQDEGEDRRADQRVRRHFA